MLHTLYIQDYALIRQLEICFEQGFSVITGETGAGKSVMLGALGLLLGQRADTKAIRTGASKCVIEAHFLLEDNLLQPFFEENELEFETECILRREVYASGKSRAFINDSPVTLVQMRELGDRLIDIHSQHQNLLLRKEDFQLSVVDIIAGNDDQRKAYGDAFKAYIQARQQLEQLRQSLQESRDNEDFLRFQQKELSEARLTAGEQEELEQQSELMSHAEEIKSSLYEADCLLTAENTGIVQQLRTFSSQMRSLERIFPTMGELAERADSAFIELKDISEEIADKLEQTDFDPRQLDEVNSRLDLIYTLQQKFHVSSIDELLQQLDNINHQLSQIDNSDEELQQQEARVEELRQKCEQLAKKLTTTREKAANKIEQEMHTRLVPLGIPNVRFEVSLGTKPLSADGIDTVAFLFSANKSTALMPVSEVASGGEIARVMLSLKAMISGAVKLPTIVFDEIDTGVSGRVAEQMAEIMREMGAADRQVISITHLPQIAALGTTHYRVSKEESPSGTISHMQQLDDNERVREIAQMLSGSNITEAAIDNAKELLKVK